MNIIDDKTIFIVPNNIKSHILKNNKKLLDIKCFNKNDLKKKLLFNYDEKTIFYIIKKYNLKVDVALMYLENMYYIDDIDYDSPKLKTLREMKKDLEKNNLLIKDVLFLNNIADYKVVVYGYDYIDKSFERLLNIIKKKVDVEIIDTYYSKNINHKIYQFDDIDDEVNFIAYSICDLIKKGTDINNIKLANVTSDYIYPLKRIFSFYNIPFNIEKKNLYGTDISLSFIEIFRQTNSIKDSFDKLVELYNFNDPNNLEIYNKLINICNKYYWYNEDTDNILDMLINDLKKTNISQSMMTNVIEEIEIRDNTISDDYYIFVMGFNQGSMPLVYKNEDYITDDLKNVILIETTYEKNIIEHDVCKKIINKLSNVIITYKLKTKTEQFYPSSLIDEIDAEIIINPEIDITKTYSIIQNRINLSKYLDGLIKYDEIDQDLGILFYNYQDTPYRIYDNKFNGIGKKELLKYLDNKLKLSYSSIDEYFKCAFKYYLSNIIKLKKSEEAFHLTIGNLFHYVLSLAFKPKFNFDKSWNDFLKDKELSDKENFFITKLRDELKFVINIINEQNKFSTLDNAMFEEKIYVKIPSSIDISFSGIVDKIMYKDNLVSIVDYKTGSTDININNVIHGLNMQLPVYLFLVKNSPKFNDPEFIGFYLQEILHNKLYYDNKKDHEKRKKDTLKLKGYTIDQESLIEQFDFTYHDSEVIKSMKLGKNGFYAYSKILNEQQINNLISLVGNKIKDGSEDIINGKFDINPKRLGKDNISCTYCEFKDICYMKDSDIVTLREYKDMSFLGGDCNE